jgi:hypothetical protein
VSLFLIRGMKCPESVRLVPINALAILKGSDRVAGCALLISLFCGGIGEKGSAAWHNN